MTSYIEERPEASFDDIDPRSLTFNIMFNCSRSSPGQIIQGFNHLSRYFNGVDEYTEHVPKTDYEKKIFSDISTLSTLIVERYLELFFNDVNDVVQKRVYGANLNGKHNDGRLYKSYTFKGLNEQAKYKTVKFGNLLNLLKQRILYHANRDISKIIRYQENEEEYKYYLELQEKCQQFYHFLDVNIKEQWTETVKQASELKTPDERESIKKDNHEKPRNEVHRSKYRLKKTIEYVGRLN